MKQIYQFRRFYVVIVLGVLFAAFVTIGALVFAGVINIAPAYGIPFWLLALAFIAIGAVLLRGIRDQNQVFTQLQLENLYTLGQPVNFFNQYQFEAHSRVLRLRRRNRKKKQYIIGFTFAPLFVASNPRHNEEISGFNYAISRFMVERFGSRKSKYRFSSAFGFSRGVFLLYACLESEEEVRTLCADLLQDIYKVGQTEKVRVVVQPFFGIYETNIHDNVAFAIDNAQIARQYGEDAFDTVTFYHESFRVSASKDDIAEIESALDKQEFVVYYQPKYSLKEKRFVSAEALVRWNSPVHGLLGPASFIDKAENAGLISNIDIYVFEHALMDLAEQRKKGRRVLPVSVNFSLYEFFSPNFLDVFMGFLDKYKIPPTLVEVEITETTSQANQFMSISLIKKLQERGVRVLMDDFGVGYSGINNLRKIPFDAIKIDKSFTDFILEDQKVASIVKYIVELGHLNDLEVIVEGVDNAEEVALLKKLRADTIQGFYYSQALPLEEYDKFLKDNEFEAKGGHK